MSDTFVTAPPEWTWFIVPYFFIGGIAGGAYFLAALLEWFGHPGDRPVIRTGYYVAATGGIVSGALLTIDLGRPERFWHMIFQSQQLPDLMFKPWSPISIGSWILLAFTGLAMLSAGGALVEEGRLTNPKFRVLRGTAFTRMVAAIGGVAGLAFAGYTGVLLTVTNRPIWADSPWLGALFLASGASTGAATLILLGRRRGAHDSSIRWLAAFDNRVLLLELVLLGVFMVSLGPVAGAWLNSWGLLLLLGVVGAGIVVPLGLHVAPARFGSLAAQPAISAAKLVLLGGFLLRLVTLLASEGIDRQVAGVGGM